MSQTPSDSERAETPQSGVPHIYNIAAGQPFLPKLAAALLDDGQRHALFGSCRLEEVQILLPTRRAARMLAGELLAQAAEAGRQALLLPRIDTLGDLDEELPDTLSAAMPDDDLPPAIDKMARHFYLLPLVEKWAAQGGLGRFNAADETPLNAVKLSALVHDLERFLDQTQNEQARLERLDDLAPEELAENWQHIVALLNIVLRFWPAQLQELGQMDPTARRNALLQKRCANWQTDPPDRPIIAAGSTGSIRATADLLAVIARLPRGAVVLPGLDETASDDLWRAVGKDDVHPQYALAQLLDHMAAGRADVQAFPGTTQASARAQLLNQALVPAQETAHWIEQKTAQAAQAPQAAHGDAPHPAAAFDGLTLIEAPDMRAEAGAIALAMRGVLEEPEKTAALVTRDRNLARRVAAELKRWDINIDDSAGQPLANLPRARLLRLILQAHHGQFAPVDLLALMKHPLVCLGQKRGRHLQHVRLLENAVLRGPRPFSGMSGYRTLLDSKEKLAADEKKAAIDLLHRLETAFAALAAIKAKARMSDYLTALMQCASALLAEAENTEGETGADILFKNDEEGRALAALFDMLHAHSALAPPMRWGDFPALFDMWLRRQNVRRQAPGQPRLSILGPLEARLMQADVMILGALNETVWPPMPETGAWLSRPMREKLGMSQPERQIGQAAHDFVQAAAAPEIYLTRAKKIDGAPSVAARWLRRIETFAGKLPRQKGDALIGWWQSLDQSAEAVSPATAPQPRPPKAARPKQLSVTQIETLLHNPYEIYARKILNLRALDAVDAPPNAAHRGIFLHALMEKFIAGGHHQADNASAAFLTLAREEEALHGGGAALMQFWQARLQALALWLADYEADRAKHIAASHVEGSGHLQLGDITVTAKADRIDRLKNGAYEIIDYKSGQPPSQKAVTGHLAPQLTLEAAILRDGGFGEAGDDISGHSAALTYLRLSGRTPAAEAKHFASNDALIDGALDMVRRLMQTYDDAAQAYPVHIRPRPRFGANNLTDLPFDHLARCPEWQEEDEA